MCTKPLESFLFCFIVLLVAGGAGGEDVRIDDEMLHGSAEPEGVVAGISPEAYEQSNSYTLNRETEVVELPGYHSAFQVGADAQESLEWVPCWDDPCVVCDARCECICILWWCDCFCVADSMVTCDTWFCWGNEACRPPW